jgi:ABC-type transporter Mla maintaining outer membrane lipid asymmetry permease subunit MlaE
MMRMNEKQLKTMTFGRKMTCFGLLIGFVIFLSGFFVNGTSQGYTFSIGLSIMVSSILLFGFGLFLILMQEVSDKSNPSLK